MKIIEGDLILKENTIIEDDVLVHGNVRCEGGNWNLNCEDCSYFAIASARNSMKVKLIKGRRKNSKHFCLDKEIEFKDKEKICPTCGSKLK